ncbi:uncharacterized protein [Montipora capricornis]|uniref:uncharacterized protein n=1 Tax=Montipora capricornis TaxID=246305 RepID=UPI0035F13C50
MNHKLFKFMNSCSLFVAIVLLLHITKRGASSPIQCKEGKFFEASVFDYFNCSVCEGQAHFTNCKLCCGSANATPTSSFSSTSSSDPTSRPGSEKSESVNPCDLKFSFTENTLPIGIGFVTGFLAALVVMGIAKLVIRSRSKSKKRHPTGYTPPQQETQPGLRSSSTVVGLDNGTGTNPNK